MKNLYLFILLFLAGLLGIKSLEELDIWIFLKTGEWIWENHQIPSTDFFSFTFEGKPWTHIKWGYSLLVFSLQKIGGGPEWMMLFQSFINMAICLMIILISDLWKKEKSLSWYSLPFFIFLWMVTEYRMNGRPENISHLMVLVYAYVFTKSAQSKKILWVLPLVQMIWSNMHDAYTLGLVLIFIFCFVQFIKSKNRIYVLICLSSILTSTINPLGIHSLVYVYDVFTQLNVNKYTPELFSWTYIEYWKQVQSYFFLLCGILFSIFNIKKNRQTFYLNWYFITSILFFIIALGAYRNIVFYFFWIAPFVLANIPSLNYFQKRNQTIAFVMASMLFFAWIAYGSYYKNIHSTHGFGLYYSEQKQPSRAITFLSKNIGTKNTCLEGNVFSDYLSSSYLLWDLHPIIKSYIDLRDLDVYTPDFFEQYHQLLQNPVLFEKEVKKYNITHIALYLKANPNIHRYLYNHNRYSLTYLDHNMAIYQDLCQEKKNKAALFTNSSLQQKDQEKICSASAFQWNKIFVFNWSKSIENQSNVNYIYAKYLEIVGDQSTLLSFLIHHKSNNLMDLNYQRLLYKTLQRYPAYQKESVLLLKHIQNLQSTEQ